MRNVINSPLFEVKPLQIPRFALPIDIISDGAPQVCIQRLEGEDTLSLPMYADWVSIIDIFPIEEGVWHFNLEVRRRTRPSHWFIAYVWHGEGRIEKLNEASTRLYGYVQNKHLRFYNLGTPCLIAIFFFAMLRDIQAVVCLGPTILAAWANFLYKRHTERQIVRAIEQALIPQ
jgi:hypothetical protein